MADDTRPPRGVSLASLEIEIQRWLTELGHSEASWTVTRATFRRFVRFASSHGVVDVVDVDAALVQQFIDAPGVRGGSPSPATQHQRRSALRLVFRLHSKNDGSIVDPTLHLALPSREADPARPLTDIEIDLIRGASLSTLHETRLPAIVALAEASAITSEIAYITSDDVDLCTRTVRLEGSRNTRARVAQLSTWGVAQLRRRIETVDDGHLVYRTSKAKPGIAHTSVAVALGRLLTKAGLGDLPNVGTGSLRATAGRRTLDATGRIDAAAHVLGCRSLDVAARLVGWDWLEDPD